MDPSPLEEVILPLPAARHRVPMSTEVRSTWLASSQHALKDRGLHDRYRAALNPAYAEVITSCVAGMWLPIDVAIAHYEACDRLDLPSRDLVAIGRQVMRHTSGTVLTIAMRLAARTSSDPMTVVGHAQRLWDRNWVGGAIGVVKTNTREARIELAGWPCARFTYCRVAMRGVLVGFLELFCDKAYAIEIPSLCSSTTMGFRLAWV